MAGIFKPNPTTSRIVASPGRFLSNKLQESVSILDYSGADSTGTTDSSEAFNRALDENDRVIVPANGTYLLEQPIRIQNDNKFLIGSGSTSVLKISPRGWFKDSCFLLARATANATIPTSGSVTLQLSGAYRFISDPHNQVVTPATDLPNATNVILGRGKQVTGTIKGVTGTLARTLAGEYVFTPTTYPGSPVAVVVDDIFASTTVGEPCGGMITILSWGSSGGDRTTRNTVIRGLKFVGLTYADLVAQFGSTVATSYDLHSWKGSRRMPKFIYSDYVDGVTIEDCEFETHSHEGIWFAGQNSGRSQRFLVRRNLFRDVGYEPTNNTPLPAIQCNFTNAIVEGNTLYRSGTAIGGSGASLQITNNKILGFAGDGISWGDNNCFDTTISNNHIYCDETNIPVGAPVNNPDRVALNGFFSGENLFYRNMVCRGNTVRLKNVQGVGIRVSSPFEAEVSNNKIYIQSPPSNNAIGIKIHNVSASGTLDCYINSNTITYEGLVNDNGILVAAIRIISANTNIVNAFLSNNSINGLISGNTNHWMILTDKSGGGDITYSLNGDRKTAGLISVPNRLINNTYPNRTPLYLSGSTLTAASAVVSPIYLDNSIVASTRNVQLAQNQAARYFSATVTDASTNAQGSGVLLVTLQYGTGRKSKTYFVSTSFDNALVNGTWYRLSPVFATDTAQLGIDLIVTSSNSGMLLELGVMSGLSGNTNVAMTILPLSGLIPTITRLDNTAFTAPKPTKWTFYDGLVKFNNAATGVVNSVDSTAVKIPIEVGGGLYYASAVDQNDRFGGTPPFSTTNLRLWLESDRAVTVDGTTGVITASSWLDNSGAALNATQATKGSQFLYLRNTLNGIPVLRSDAAGRRFSVPSFTLANGITLIALLRLTGNGNFQGLFSKSTGAAAAPFDMLTGNGNRTFQVAGASNGQTTALVTNTWYVLSVTHDKTNIAYFLDGVADGTATGGWGVNDTGNIWIGARDDNGTKLLGDIAALIVYDGVDNTARAAVETYFRGKRGF